MKELLNKLREANLPITKEDFINACNQSSLFAEFVQDIEESEDVTVKTYWKEDKFYRLKFNGSYLFLFTIKGFTDVIHSALWKYAEKHLPNKYIAEVMSDNAFPTDESTLELINDDYYHEHLIDILLDVSNSYRGFYYYGDISRLEVETGFARVNLEGTIFYLLG